MDLENTLKQFLGGVRRVGKSIKVEQVSPFEALEMLKVGIVPSKQGPQEEPEGYTFEMAGISIVVAGYTTKEEFLDAVEAAGLNRGEFSLVPEGYNFQRIKRG